MSELVFERESAISFPFPDPCTLACQRDMVATVRGRVKDGTRCSSDPKVHDVCIEGVCKVS